MYIGCPITNPPQRHTGERMPVLFAWIGFSPLPLPYLGAVEDKLRTLNVPLLCDTSLAFHKKFIALKICFRYHNPKLWP